MNITDKIKQIESDYNVKVLYLTKSGSHLYGTSDTESDLDYKGIFVSNSDDVLLKRDRDYVKANTNNTNQKNNSDDIDFHLDSLHQWTHLLAKGETGALDLLFSTLARDTIIYYDPTFMAILGNNYKKLLTKKPQAFVGYAIGQSKRYNVKGQRYNELVQFNKYLGYLTDCDNHYSYEEDDNLAEAFDAITNYLSEYSYKYINYVQAPAPRGNKAITWIYLEVLGKKFAPNITIEYLQEKLTEMENSYGSRAKAATDNIDWKALSHAVRVILEIEELLTNSFITFPLLEADYVYSVKKGKIPVEQVLQLIETKISLIDELVESTDLPDTVDQDFIDGLLLSYYKD